MRQRALLKFGCDPCIGPPSAPPFIRRIPSPVTPALAVLACARCTARPQSSADPRNRREVHRRPAGRKARSAASSHGSSAAAVAVFGTCAVAAAAAVSAAVASTRTSRSQAAHAKESFREHRTAQTNVPSQTHQHHTQPTVNEQTTADRVVLCRSRVASPDCARTATAAPRTWPASEAEGNHDRETNWNAWPMEKQSDHRQQNA